MRIKVTSPSNTKLKIARSLHSRAGILKHGLFLMEGPRFISDYLKAGTPELILMSDSTGRLSETVAEEAAGMSITVMEISEKLFSDISDTETSQGITAVCPLPSVNIDRFPLKGVFLMLDGISDPGNMGTIIRSAAAFGCTVVITGTGSCCPFAPKVTRAAAGMNATVPIIFDADLAAFMQSNSHTMEFIGADASGGNIDRLHGRDRCTGLVIGSEAHGISEEIKKHLSWTVAIPLVGGVESLNAAVSASILLYELGAGPDI
ncbi:MAG: RNA methyltransferase [Candidatus Aegiribacteria sp.]|nr:RNA methyltransferase [Candidatus Aegiribacteria sp.]